MTEFENNIDTKELVFEKEPFIYQTGIKGLLVLSRPFRADNRGSFQENSRNKDIETLLGRNVNFVQSSTSEMIPNTIKGIHCERQDKLLQPIVGVYIFVDVDLRPDSPTFKKWVMIQITANLGERRYFIFVPNGCGNSIAILGNSTAVMNYQTSEIYDPIEAERVVRYDDPELNIPWPIKTPIVSERDLGGKSLSKFIDLYHERS